MTRGVYCVDFLDKVFRVLGRVGKTLGLANADWCEEMTLALFETRPGAALLEKLKF